LRVFPDIGRVSCFDGSGAPLQREVGDDFHVFRASAPLQRGRGRYNCTYPSARSGRYHWFSQFWYVPRPRGPSPGAGSAP
jgi:hypothetical protein